MYNVDYLNQCEKSKRHFFGNGNPRDLPLSSQYVPPSSLKIVKCVEDVNGEWVPVTLEAYL